MNKVVYKGKIRKTEEGKIKQLQLALDKLFSEAEQEKLEFYGDIETDSYYSFDVVYGNSRFELRYDNSNGLVFKINK